LSHICISLLLFLIQKSGPFLLFWELNARVKDVRFRSKQIIQSSMRILRFIFVVNSDRMRFLLSLMKKSEALGWICSDLAESFFNLRTKSSGLSSPNGHITIVTRVRLTRTLSFSGHALPSAQSVPLLASFALGKISYNLMNLLLTEGDLGISSNFLIPLSLHLSDEICLFRAGCAMNDVVSSSFQSSPHPFPNIRVNFPAAE